MTNGIPETRTHDAVNEITTITIDGNPPSSLNYDNNGNLTADSVYTYAYDEENRLIAATRNSDSVVVGQYQYDALSRRVQKIANSAGTPATTRYFYDDARIIEEQDTSGTTQATYVYGNYVDEVLTMDRAGQTYYYHENALWSVEAITDSTATVVERDAYDAYGAPTTLPEGIGNPYLFTGRQLDTETGIYFYRARYHDPLKGRFLQRAPSERFAGNNLYEYVDSRPTYLSDPNGHPLALILGLGLVAVLGLILASELDTATTPPTPPPPVRPAMVIEKRLTHEELGQKPLQSDSYILADPARIQRLDPNIGAMTPQLIEGQLYFKKGTREHELATLDNIVARAGPQAVRDLGGRISQGFLGNILYPNCFDSREALRGAIADIVAKEGASLDYYEFVNIIHAPDELNQHTYLGLRRRDTKEVVAFIDLWRGVRQHGRLTPISENTYRVDQVENVLILERKPAK